ncbi:probable E3 ubiquitin-protein ligase MARCH2 at N-terminal half [Coccomyxa sp. Obi]|nr:probable E3 ubiquitin-protein ligase MARCH2 at N-terminal half [Coccomyxa sp. Obi]
MRFPSPRPPVLRWPGSGKQSSISSEEIKSYNGKDNTCRICWEGADAEPDGSLIAPCTCKGTTRYVHIRCLRKWKLARLAAGDVRASDFCEICHSRYKLPHGMPRRPPPASWLVDWLRQSIAQAKDLINRDPQKLLERICQVSFAANAVIQGSYYAGRGLQRGFLSSTQSLGPRMLAFLGWVPELILGSAAFPPLQFPIFASSTAIIIASLVEVAVCSAAGAYLGFLYGSSVGTLRLLHWAVSVTLAVPLRTCGLLQGGLSKALSRGGLVLSSIFCGSKSKASASTFLVQVCLIRFLFGRR